MKRYLVIFFLIPLAYYPAYISNELLVSLTREDGIYESVGALFWLSTSITFVILAMKPKHYIGEQQDNQYRERKYFWLFAVLFFFAFGEEISWGQRIFNYATPEVLERINVQNEVNIHNLNIFHGKTEDGEDKTGIMALFTMHRLFYMTFFIYLFLIPMLYKINSKARSLIQRFNIPVPHILLGVLFIVNLFYGNILRSLNNDLNGHGIVEIKETVMALILFALPWCWISFKKFKLKPLN